MTALAILAHCLLASAPAAPAASGEPDYAGTARALATELTARSFDKAVARFDPAIAKSLPAKVLEKQWQSMVGDLGAYQKLNVVRTEDGPKGKAVYVECVYEKGSLHLRVVVNDKLQVVGLRPVPGQSPEAFEAAAREAVADLAAGAFARLESRFSPEMSKALPAGATAKAWQGVVAKNGAFQKVLGTKIEPDAKFGIADVECAYAGQVAIIRVVFNAQLKVDGLFFRPAWNPPDYATAAAFEERPVIVGSAALPLEGTLSLPKGKGPFPAVVLVHGSGPNDADESSGPNKLFKDLAWGLASRKVVVLRYNKRTFQHRGKLSNADLPTVKEETVDDALTAVALLARTKEVDPKRIFVIGHSLGAGLSPRIAAADERVHGIVMLAAASRSQWHLEVEQLEYLTSLGGKRTPAGEKAVEQAKENAKKLDDPKLVASDVVDGIPGSYWLDLRGYDTVKALQRLGRPILVLQGARDYQVTLTDFEGWKTALAGKKNATLKVYPALNHHFMPGEGRSTPAEYQTPNHASKEAVEDLADWLAKH